MHHVASMPAGLHGERVGCQSVGPALSIFLFGRLFDMECKALLRPGHRAAHS